MPRILLAMLVVVAAGAADDPIGDALPLLQVPRLKSPPAVTADSRDPAWSNAATIPGLGLSRRDGVPLAPPIATTVRLGWDPSSLYVRFICTDADVYLPNSGRDADLYRGDVAEVFLDVVGDGQAVLELQANAAGDLFDQMILLTTAARYRPNGGLSWASWSGISGQTVAGIWTACAGPASRWPMVPAGSWASRSQPRPACAVSD